MHCLKVSALNILLLPVIIYHVLQVCIREHVNIYHALIVVYTFVSERQSAYSILESFCIM